MNRLSITLLPSSSTVQGNAWQKGRTQDQYCPVGKLLATERQKVTVCTEARQLRGLPELARELTTVSPLSREKDLPILIAGGKDFYAPNSPEKSHAGVCWRRGGVVVGASPPPAWSK